MAILVTNRMDDHCYCEPILATMRWERQTWKWLKYNEEMLGNKKGDETIVQALETMIEMDLHCEWDKTWEVRQETPPKREQKSSKKALLAIDREETDQF